MSEAIRRSVCAHDCWDTCGLHVAVRDGRVAAVRGDPAHPVTRGFICSKVTQYPDRIYGAQRLLQPLRRTGVKGEGRFVPISWDDALGEIAEQLGRIARDFRPDSILPYSYAGTLGVLNYASMDRRFFHRLGASRLLRTICTGAASEALQVTLGASMGPDPLDMVHCRLILIWGLNPLATNIHQVPILAEARRRGAIVVVIDPYRHEAAERADWHLPVRPGSDGALALGLMHVLVGEGWIDTDYVGRYTVGFEQLIGRLRDYPPERVAEWTGIAADDIRRLAKLYGTVQPSVIRLGYGLQRHSNGGQAVRAIAILPALVGAWRYPGGGLLLSNSGSFPLNRQALERPDLLRRKPRTVNMIRLGEALTAADPPVRALFVYNANPAAVAPNGGRVRQGLEREDLFTVVHDQLLTDTARYADIVLPATTMLEHFDLYASYWHLYLSAAEPVIEPVGQSVPNVELFRRLAKAMGFAETCFRDSDEELARQALASDHPALRGITLERLLREGYVRLAVGEPGTYAPFRQGGFPTPSGKVEIYSETLRQRGLDPLPYWDPPRDGHRPLTAPGEELILLSPKAPRFLNSSFSAVPALLHREGAPSLLLNPADAKPRGIVEGTWVRVENERGFCLLLAKLSERVPPGVAVTFSTWWPSLAPEGQNVNATTSDAEADLGGGAVFYSNRVCIAPASGP